MTKLVILVVSLILFKEVIMKFINIADDGITAVILDLNSLHLPAGEIEW